MLKNNKQRGLGLRLVEAHEALDACFETTSRPGMEGMALYRWVDFSGYSEVMCTIGLPVDVMFVAFVALRVHYF